MVEIITHGDKTLRPLYTRRCPECGCVFQYTRDYAKPICGTDNEIRFVVCPECGYKYIPHAGATQTTYENPAEGNVVD